MIERLRAKKDMKGESLSDSDISDMAAQLNRSNNAKSEVGLDQGDEFLRKESCVALSKRRKS